MKKLLLLLIASLSLSASAQKSNPAFPPPRVDKRVELVSIVFRLAGNQEYNQDRFKLYTDKIDEHFGPYKDHDLIKLARTYREEHGVSYDAPMGLAIRLDDKLRLNVKKTDSTLDERWDRGKLEQFSRLLRKFVKDAKYEAFWNSNADMYAEASRRFLPVYEAVDVEWYKNFYGQEPRENFRVVNALVCGPCNYGPNVPRANGMTDVYAMIGAWTTDSMGMVRFSRDEFLLTLIHEFNHSFVKYLQTADSAKLNACGARVMVKIGEHMNQHAYSTWESVFNEAMVRASVIKYMIDHSFPANNIVQERNMQRQFGFVWVDKLVDEMEKYDKQRDKYPTMESYMPQIVAAHEDIATLIENYEDLRPKVISISEFTNGDSCVNSQTKTITVNFDKPLRGRGYSMNYGPKGSDAMPKMSNIKYTNANKSVVFTVELLPNKEYQFTLLGLTFTTPDLVPMNPYLVSFKTLE